MLRCMFLPDGFDPSEVQILLWGEAQDLHVAADGFRRWASQPLSGSVDGLPSAIRFVEGSPPNGMANVGDNLVWSLTPTDAERFALLSDALADNDTPGHYYLDVDAPRSAGLTVKISKGEHPPDFPRHEAGAQ